jgi:cysteine desulfurase family protein (TIGR01976 family)
VTSSASANPAAPAQPDIEAIRAHFPTLATAPDILLDNAGGSQVPAVVAEAVRDYMLGTYVQLGADYETAKRSTETVARAHGFINLFLNGEGVGQTILGSSATALCYMLADCYARAPHPTRNEIIVVDTAHEANAGPWFRLESRSYTVRLWRARAGSLELHLDDLRELLSERTRLVAFPHVSNILGRVEDAGAITRLAHEAGARVVVDGVAYAPHRAIDVKDLHADWYLYSTYKVFGPHMGALFGTHEAMAELEGPNHFFIAKDETPYKFELGGASHEGCAALLALWKYLAAVVGENPQGEAQRRIIEAAFKRFAALEEPLQARLLEYLGARDDIRMIGPSETGPQRVPTISFVHETKRSADVVKAINAQRVGIRFGHFYAYRLCDRLARDGVLHDVNDGVIRTSAVHYNTLAEIDRLIELFERAL